MIAVGNARENDSPADARTFDRVLETVWAVRRFDDERRDAGVADRVFG